MLGSPDYVVVDVAFSLEEHIGLADRVGLVVDFLPVEVRGGLLAFLYGESVEGLFGDGQHAPGADGAVVEEIRAGLDPVLYGMKYQLGHEFHGVPGGPVFAGFFVVVLVEAAYQVLKDRAQAWLSRPGSLTESSALRTGLGLRLIWGERKWLTMLPKTSPWDSRVIWLRNSNLSRMSWTLGEKLSR